MAQDWNKVLQEPNIDPKVWERWKQLARRGDGVKIAAAHKQQPPAVSRALKWGYVNNDKLESDISTFFAKRLEREAKYGPDKETPKVSAASSKLLKMKVV